MFKYTSRKRSSTLIRNMKEIPMVGLIKMWRLDVLPFLFSPKYSIGSLQPLVFQEAIWMHNKTRKMSFIFSQWIFLYRCHFLNVFHPTCPIRQQGYTLLKACSLIMYLCFITNMVNNNENNEFVSLLLDIGHLG